MLINILMATLILGAIGLVLGAALSLASKAFYVKEDDRKAKIIAYLPGANCGGCGFAGCANYADAIINGDVPTNRCPSCDQSAIDEISKIVGVQAEKAASKVAHVKCSGGNLYANKKYDYHGMTDCAAAARLLDGFMECKYGCLGFGTCASVCPNDAINIIDGVAKVDKALCTGCGVCVKTCPKHVIDLIPYDTNVIVQCSNHDKGAQTKKNCSSGCLGCKICEKTCEHGAITVVENVAHIDFSKCIQCGKCAEKCPSKIIRIK